jgi:hypothetical protein
MRNEPVNGLIGFQINISLYFSIRIRALQFSNNQTKREIKI